MLEGIFLMERFLSPDAYLRGIFMNYMSLFIFVFKSNLKQLYCLIERGLRFTLKAKTKHKQAKPSKTIKFSENAELT